MKHLLQQAVRHLEVPPNDELIKTMLDPFKTVDDYFAFFIPLSEHLMSSSKGLIRLKPKSRFQAETLSWLREFIAARRRMLEASDRETGSP